MPLMESNKLDMTKEGIRVLGDRLTEAFQTEIQKEKEKQNKKSKNPKTEVQFQKFSIHKTGIPEMRKWRRNTSSNKS